MKHTHLDMKISDALKSDISYLLSLDSIHWGKLRNSTVLITGATGLVGGLLVRVLAAASAVHDLDIRLIATGRSAAKGDTLSTECGVEFIAGDIRKPLPEGAIPSSIDYIFHCAAITKSADMVAKPVDVISTETDGTYAILNLARQKHCRSLVYLSSMEVYGQANQREVSEGDLGYIDLSSTRSCYPEGKRFCELLCLAYAAQYGVPVKIARLAMTFGAGTPKDKNNMRVASQFVHKALANEDIELHTLGNSIANCCYTADAVCGLLIILLDGKDGEAYNVANPLASATIREMAELVTNKVCNGIIKVIVNVPKDIEKRGYAPDVIYTLNADKLKKLGWVPKFGLEDMYRQMIADWRG